MIGVLGQYPCQNAGNSANYHQAKNRTKHGNKLALASNGSTHLCRG
jgi:hypothetical protein